jgi:hypothetical protein
VAAGFLVAIYFGLSWASDKIIWKTDLYGQYYNGLTRCEHVASIAIYLYILKEIVMKLKQEKMPLERNY